MWTNTFSVFSSVGIAVSGTSSIASIWPVVSAVTRASSASNVWKITPSMFGGAAQYSVFAASSTEIALVRLDERERTGPDHLLVAELDRILDVLPDVLRAGRR